MVFWNIGVDKPIAPTEAMPPMPAIPAGELYLTNPQVGAVYAYGQKDYRGSNTYIAYVVYRGDEKLEWIEKKDLVRELSK